jgi:hypothetical protein
MSDLDTVEEFKVKGQVLPPQIVTAPHVVTPTINTVSKTLSSSRHGDSIKSSSELHSSIREDESMSAVKSESSKWNTHNLHLRLAADAVSAASAAVLVAPLIASIDKYVVVLH